LTSIWIFIAFGVVAAVIGLLFERRRRSGTGGAPPPPDLAPLDDSDFRARVLDEIEAGRKIEAIRIVRERTRLGLGEAKALVDALAAGDDSVEISTAAVDPADDVARVALADPDLGARLVMEIAAGRKIEAIKLLRERTGIGLREARDAIEAMERGD
jgi:ribosomal protein L7/L12